MPVLWTTWMARSSQSSIISKSFLSVTSKSGSPFSANHFLVAARPSSLPARAVKILIRTPLASQACTLRIMSGTGGPMCDMLSQRPASARVPSKSTPTQGVLGSGLVSGTRSSGTGSSGAFDKSISSVGLGWRPRILRNHSNMSHVSQNRGQRARGTS